MKYRGILFDKDGTLIDFQRSWLPVFKLAADEFVGGDERLAALLLEAGGYDAGADRIVGGSLLAVASNHQVAQCWSRLLGGGPGVDRMTRRLADILRQQAPRHVVPVAGLGETLHALRRDGYRLGIATSDSLTGIHNTLGDFDVLDYFDFLAGYDSGHGTKPGGGMLRAFCAATAIDARAVVVVGDNDHDIAMGRDGGAGLCVGVLTGTSTRAELEPVADVVVDGIPDLAAILC